MAKNLDSLSPNKTSPEIANSTIPPVTVPTAEEKIAVSTAPAEKSTEPEPIKPLPVSKEPESSPVTQTTTDISTPTEKIETAQAVIIPPVVKSEITNPPPVSPPNNDSFESLFPEPSVSIVTPPTWIWWILLIVGAIGLGLVGYYLINGKSSTALPFLSKNTAPTAVTSPPPTAATHTITTASPPSTSPSPVSSPSSSPVASASPSSLDKSQVTLRVLNGTTVTGAASSAATILEKAGFTVRTTGNAQNQTYTQTFVYYQTGNLLAAQSVQAALQKYSPQLQESTLATPDKVLVVIGS